jgi:hypothetical protein
MAVLMAERIDRPASLFGPAPEAPEEHGDASAGGREGDLGGGLTLDETIVGVWEGLAAQVAVACPMCGGALRPRGGDGFAASGGCCEECGTTLA